MNRDPKQLTVHPSIKLFPMLTFEQYEAIKQSIQERGMLRPIIIDNDGKVIDGRNRLKAALDLGMDEVPVEVRSDVDAVEYAIETAATGRQLSKTAICMLLVEHHPAIACDRSSRKGGRPLSETVDSVNSYSKDKKTPMISRVDSVNTEDSFRGLSKQYQVPFEYFSRIVKCLGMCRNKSDADRLRIMVYEHEVSATNLEKALLGWIASHTDGEHVDDDTLHNEPVGRRNPPDYTRFYTHIKFLENTFSAFESQPPQSKAAFRDALVGWVSKWPDDYKKEVMRALRS